MIVFVFFLLFTTLTFTLRQSRALALTRDTKDWVLDGAGLVVQGIVVPVLEVVLVFELLAAVVPQYRGVWDLPAAGAFLINFVLVDYLYYWNHRWLHSRLLWPAHAVHHTAEQTDIFITARNTLWTPLLIVYVWVNGLFLFLLAEPAAFILGGSLTACLDLWRHSAFTLRAYPALHRALGRIFITPHEHAWHHSRNDTNCNFGANFSVWDRLHGTYRSPLHPAEQFGVPLALSLKRKLLFPFGARGL